MLNNIEYVIFMILCYLVIIDFYWVWFFYKFWKKIIFEGKLKLIVYCMKKFNYGKEEWVLSSVLFCDLNNKYNYKLKINISFENIVFFFFRLY